MKKVLLHEMTRGYFEEYLKENPKAVAIIPVGSIEQHGPHLPLGSDIISALYRCIKIAELTNSVVVHPCLAGHSPHHLDFKGTISLKSETLIAVLMDTIESLKQHGIERILFVNTHIGNDHIIEFVRKEASFKYGVTIANPKLCPKNFMDRLLERKYRNLDIHAGKGETSVMLGIKPDLVDMERVKGWKPSVKLSEKLLKLIEKEPKTEVDYLMIDTLLPDRTIDVTDTGIYGFSDPSSALDDNNLEKSLEFIVEFIRKWQEF